MERSLNKRDNARDKHRGESIIYKVGNGCDTQREGVGFISGITLGIGTEGRVVFIIEIMLETTTEERVCFIREILLGTDSEGRRDFVTDISVETGT